jgi:hypothetical protein
MDRRIRREGDGDRSGGADHAGAHNRGGSRRSALHGPAENTKSGDGPETEVTRVAGRRDIRTAVDDLLRQPPATPPELFLRLLQFDHGEAYAELVRRLVDTELDGERQLMVIQWLIEIGADDPPAQLPRGRRGDRRSGNAGYRGGGVLRAVQ